MSDPSAQSHTNEARHIISVTECLRQDIRMLEAEIAKLREDPYAWYESAQRVNAELRERADAMADALERWWGGKCPEAWSEKRHHDRPYVNLQGSHERGLVDALAAYLEGEK